MTNKFQGPATTAQAPTSYASAVGSSNSPVYVSKTDVSSPNNMKDVLILSPITNGGIVEDPDSVKKAISDKMKTVPFDIPSTSGKTGNIAIRFPNRDARDSGMKAISDGTFLTDSGYSCRDAAKMLPKVTLFDVPSLVISTVDKLNKTESEI